MTVRLDGDLDSDMLSAMRAEFDRAVNSSTAAVVADLTGVEFLSLEAVAVLLHVVRHCRVLQRQVRFVPSSSVTRKLIVLGLCDILPIRSAD